MDKRKVKSYKDHNHKVKLDELNKELKVYREFIAGLKKIDNSLTSISDLDNYLNHKTKFVNGGLSALALGLQKEYDTLTNLSERCSSIDAKNLTKDLEFKQSYLKDLKDSFTTYFTDEELQAREILDRLMKEYNALSPQYRYLIGITHSQKLAYTIYANSKINL